MLNNSSTKETIFGFVQSNSFELVNKVDQSTGAALVRVWFGFSTLAKVVDSSELCLWTFTGD